MSKPTPIREAIYHVEPEGRLYTLNGVGYMSAETAWDVAIICAKLLPGCTIFIRRGHEIYGSIMVQPLKEELCV